MSSKYNNNKKQGNVFKNWLCPSFLLLLKKSELPKLWGGCSPPRPSGPYAYGFGVCSFITYLFISLKAFSSPEPLGLICNRPRFPTTWPRNDGLWGLNLVPRVPRGPFYPCRWPKGSRPLGTRLRLCQLESMRIEVMQTTFNCQKCQNSIVFNAWLPVTSKAPKCLMRRLLVWIP